MVHLVLEFLIILTTIGSWVRMFKKGGGRVLSQRGLESLKYYTCLSCYSLTRLSVARATVFANLPTTVSVLLL
jgi:hypothetical protein